MSGRILFEGRIRVTSTNGLVAALDAGPEIVRIEIPDETLARTLGRLAPLSLLRQLAGLWRRISGQPVEIHVGGIRIAQWSPDDDTKTLAGRLTGVPGLKLDAAALSRLAAGALFRRKPL